MASSIGSQNSVSFLLTIQATGLLTFTLVGLSPTEYASLSLDTPTCRLIPAHVAVGTPITRRPPHRSVRAALPHTAPTLDNGGKKKVLAAHHTIRGTRELPRCVGSVLD